MPCVQPILFSRAPCAPSCAAFPSVSVKKPEGRGRRSARSPGVSPEDPFGIARTPRGSARTAFSVPGTAQTRMPSPGLAWRSAHQHHQSGHQRGHHGQHRSDVPRAAHHVAEHAEARALGQQIHAALRALTRIRLPNVGMHRTNIDLPAACSLIHRTLPRTACSPKNSVRFLRRWPLICINTLFSSHPTMIIHRCQATLYARCVWGACGNPENVLKQPV